MNLYLRKVIHSQAADNYRVVLKEHGDDIELGSIGIQAGGGARYVWAWAIDTVVPMRDIGGRGRGADRSDCMRQFRAAWDRLWADPPRRVDFLRAKRAHLP